MFFAPLPWPDESGEKVFAQKARVSSIPKKSAPSRMSWKVEMAGQTHQTLRVLEDAPAFFSLDFLARVPLPHEYDQTHPQD
jgi:hypothetical protein